MKKGVKRKVKRGTKEETKKETKKESKLGILLGVGISKKGTLSHEAKTRVKKAYKLFKKNKINKLILSGGFTSRTYPKISEAKAYQQYLIKKGIKRNQLILEERSKDTIGNAIYSKKVINKNKLNKSKNKQKEITLITSNYHLDRALRVFQHIYGKNYTFIPVKSRPKLLHKIQNMLAEMESVGLDHLFLTQIKKGDHRKAETLLKKELPMYK